MKNKAVGLFVLASLVGGAAVMKAETPRQERREERRVERREERREERRGERRENWEKFEKRHPERAKLIEERRAKTRQINADFRSGKITQAQAAQMRAQLRAEAQQQRADVLARKRTGKGATLNRTQSRQSQGELNAVQPRSPTAK